MAAGAYNRFSVLLTRVVAVKFFDGAAGGYGKRVRFRREPQNPRDADAIAAFNPRGEQIGYLPRGVSVWLAPFLDMGLVRIGGILYDAEKDGAIDVTIAVRAGPGIASLFARIAGADAEAARHNMLVDLWERQDAYEPTALRDLLHDLRKTLDDPSLPPRTRFLYHMLRGRVQRRLMAIDRVWRRRLRNFVRGLRFGAPLGWAEAALAPVFGADSPDAGPTLSEPVVLSPLLGGMAEAMRELHERVRWPSGARGWLGIYRGGFHGFYWYEREELARINWSPALLQMLDSSLMLARADAVTVDLAEHRRLLEKYWSGRHSFYEPAPTVNSQGMLTCRIMAGSLEGWAVTRGEEILRLIVSGYSLNLFVPEALLI